MPIQNIVTNYTGREKDINIFPTVNPRLTGSQQVTPSFGKISSYCAGVQKLIQRYIIALTTIQGSQPSFPTFGTEFLKLVTVSRLTTVADLTHTFNFANSLVINQFRSYQATRSDIPVDEQLDTVMLLDITVSLGSEVNFRLALYTKAGTYYNFLLPIPISI